MVNLGFDGNCFVFELQKNVYALIFFGLRVKMCVWLGVSRGLDLAFLNAD